MHKNENRRCRPAAVLSELSVNISKAHKLAWLHAREDVAIAAQWSSFITVASAASSGCTGSRIKGSAAGATAVAVADVDASVHAAAEAGAIL